MNKKWRLSDSGLQIYEGSKHVATAHYGGNPMVDINEAIENATIIRQAPALLDRLAALEAENAKLREALTAFFAAADRLTANSVDITAWDMLDEAKAAARALLEGK